MKCKTDHVYLEKEKNQIVAFHFWFINDNSGFTFSLTISVLYSGSLYFTARQHSLAPHSAFV